MWGAVFIVSVEPSVDINSMPALGEILNIQLSSSETGGRSFTVGKDRIPKRN